jgi:hypothetical protein
MKRIYLAQQQWDAQMVRDLLLANGINAIVLPPNDPLKYGEQAVWIGNDDDEARALELVNTFRATPQVSLTDAAFVWPWQCATCGERIEPQFDQCWNCGTARGSD